MSHYREIACDIIHNHCPPSVITLRLKHVQDVSIISLWDIEVCPQLKTCWPDLLDIVGMGRIPFWDCKSAKSCSAKDQGTCEQIWNQASCGKKGKLHQHQLKIASNKLYWFDGKSELSHRHFVSCRTFADSFKTCERPWNITRTHPSCPNQKIQLDSIHCIQQGSVLKFQNQLWLCNWCSCQFQEFIFC